MTDSTAGWQADPTGRHEHRYWDGTQWTDNVADAGVSASDPYSGTHPGPSAADASAARADAPDGAGAPAPDSPAEPTVAMPAAPGDPTSTWAAAPPAPPAYLPPPGGPGAPGGPPPADGGSNKKMLIGLGILVILALAVGAFFLLGNKDDGDSRAEIKADLISALGDDADFTDKQMSCLADHIIDKIGVDRLKGVDFKADEPPAHLEDDFTAAAFSGMEACDIGMGDFDDDDEDATDDTLDTIPFDDEDEDAFGSDSGMDFDADFEDMLADIYADSFGISEKKAKCLAGKIADAMESGDLAEEEMMSDIFEYFSACDISMSELGGAGSTTG